ncbi:MAG: hypothetical protein HY694_12705 [Deltaproteobacteria bacterium]|nr:hypothetical protein [Deltaproteobacteria bacterium]
METKRTITRLLLGLVWWNNGGQANNETLAILREIPMRFIKRAAIGLMVAGMVAGLYSVNAQAYQVFVGYADDEHLDPPPSGSFPSPWDGSPSVIRFAGAGVGTRFDAGAIMITNDGPTDIRFDNLTVSGFENGEIFTLWNNFAPTMIPPGKSMIFTQTAFCPPGAPSSCFNFDTSDQPAHGPPASGAIPRVRIMVDGFTQEFFDTSQVLNTGGIDPGFDGRRNESHQWCLIGAFCGTFSQLSGNAIGLGRGAKRAASTFTGKFTSGGSLNLKDIRTLTIMRLLDEEEVGGSGEVVRRIPITLAGPGDGTFTTPLDAPFFASAQIKAKGNEQFTFVLKVRQATSAVPSACPSTTLTSTFVFRGAVGSGVTPVDLTTERPWRCFGTGNRYMRTP